MSWRARGAVALTALLLVLAQVRSLRNEAAREKGFAVVLTADTGGVLVPCETSRNELGGLPRRAGLMEGLRKRGPVLVLDAGGAPSGLLPYELTAFEYILRAEMLTGIAAHNLGAPEVGLGAGVLRQMAHDLKVPFVSANVRIVGGKLFGQRSLVTDLAGYTLGITGVTAPPPSGPGEGLRVDDPRQALMEVLPELRRRSDVIIVLAYLESASLKLLASQLPEADLVLGGPTGKPLPPSRQGRKVIASGAAQGRSATVLHVKPPETRGRRVSWTGSFQELVEGMRESEPVLEIVRDFQRELKWRNFPPDKTPFAPRLGPDLPDGFFATGLDRCVTCHPAAAQTWLKSRHAEATAALGDVGFSRDPYCLQCHTTCYGFPGGFGQPSQAGPRNDVGCESCHGPSEAHANHPGTPTAWTAREACAACHDEENSPGFSYESWFKRIAH
ncbi:MAG: hypothetical protein HY303_01920 [Candidatus Wallbacteria bacterium]|nr:hypothetical protein [Candidatus Wallbacteria bacterium]